MSQPRNGQGTASRTFSRSVNRRSFLGQLGAAAALAPLILPSRARGTVTASNRINLAFIGTGRQVAYANLPMFLASTEVQVVAVAASTVDAVPSESQAFGTEAWAMTPAPAVEPPASFDPARWGPGIKAPPMAAGRR